MIRLGDITDYRTCLERRIVTKEPMEGIRGSYGFRFKSSCFYCNKSKVETRLYVRNTGRAWDELKTLEDKACANPCANSLREWCDRVLLDVYKALLFGRQLDLSFFIAHEITDLRAAIESAWNQSFDGRLMGYVLGESAPKLHMMRSCGEQGSITGFYDDLVRVRFYLEDYTECIIFSSAHQVAKHMRKLAVIDFDAIVTQICPRLASEAQHASV